MLVIDLAKLAPGAQLRLRRVVLGLTQTELARLLGGSQAEVTRVERAHPKASRRFTARMVAALADLEAAAGPAASTE